MDNDVSVPDKLIPIAEDITTIAAAVVTVRSFLISRYITHYVEEIYRLYTNITSVIWNNSFKLDINYRNGGKGLNNYHKITSIFLFRKIDYSSFPYVHFFHEQPICGTRYQTSVSLSIDLRNWNQVLFGVINQNLINQVT